MAITDFGLSGDGFLAPRQSDFLTAIRDRIEANLTALGYTEMPDWERDDFMGQVTEAMSYMLGELGDMAQAVYDARSVANATGLQLSNLALIVGVTRQVETYSTAIVTATGTDGTYIAPGKTVQIGTDGARWTVTDGGTIGAVTSGEVDLTVRAEEGGPVIATAGQIDTIVTPVSGWTAVTNDDPADPGQARETDAQLRARRLQALQTAGGGNTNAIRGALLDLDIVSGATVIDNPTNAAATIDGITVAAYGVAAVVSPNTLGTDDQETVAAAIYGKLGAGTATSGSTSATVTKGDGRSETINFTMAADTAVTVAYVLELEAGYIVADVSGDLTDLVTDYFLTLGPGATVYPTPLIALAAAVTGIKNVTTLTLNGGAVPVTHDADEQPTLSGPTIS